MTVGLSKGTQGLGHIGWITVKCRICATRLDLSGRKPGVVRGLQVVYYCPKCYRDHDTYLCHADARRVKYKCPYCGSQLAVFSPLLEED